VFGVQDEFLPEIIYYFPTSEIYSTHRSAFDVETITIKMDKFIRWQLPFEKLDLKKVEFSNWNCERTQLTKQKKG
jgi:hypothetical protein